jgi:hypothetical protein
MGGYYNVVVAGRMDWNPIGTGVEYHTDERGTQTNNGQ